MARSFAAVLLPAVLPLAAAAAPLPPGTHNLVVSSAGREWECAVRVPKGYDPNEPPPLVVGFHGAGGRGDHFLTHNRWAAVADAGGFVCACPSGLPARADRPPDFRTNPRLWNSGQLGRLNPRAKVDDLRFFDDLLAELAGQAPYDPARVYVTGHSNGATMAFRLAAERAGKVAAVAPVAGLMAVADPKPARPVPTLYVVGTADPTHPLAGGKVTLPWGPPRTDKPLGEYLAAWAKGNGNDPEPRPVSDADGVKVVEYPPAADGAVFRAVYLDGHGHGWPGTKGRGLVDRMMGPNKTTYDATAAIWEFFRAHGRR